MSATPPVRRQLTLFVPEGAAPWLAPVRAVLDPVQAALIAAHVTLCREDELADLALPDLRDRLARAAPLSLTFGPVQRVGGHGLLLPCLQSAVEFQRLRATALGATSPRASEAHLTLAHPQNPRAPGNTDARLGALPALLVLRFHEVALIEQRAAHPWVVLETMRLGEGRA